MQDWRTRKSQNPLRKRQIRDRRESNADGRRKLKIKDLQDGMKRVAMEAKVAEKSDTREVTSKLKGQTFMIADAVVEDETGTIKLTLWNEQIDQVNVNDTVKIENGYVTSFKGEIQLNIGKYGKLTVK
jgi:replication factor A1